MGRNSDHDYGSPLCVKQGQLDVAVEGCFGKVGASPTLSTPLTSAIGE
jgi:hypothetical protein